MAGLSEQFLRTENRRSSRGGRTAAKVTFTNDSSVSPSASTSRKSVTRLT